MSGSPALAFGALVAGAVVLDYGVKNAGAAFTNAAANVTSSGGATADSGAGNPQSVGNFPAAVNPVPHGTSSRLDQGIDVTTRDWLSPWSGKVLIADARNAGWKGGGYIAIQSDSDPNMVYYAAEGITPIVKVGDIVRAGQRIAYPVANPYNGVVGNGEIGRANPHAPGQPLAQVVSNAAGMVDDFAAWLYKLGVPRATSTGDAGHG